MFGTETGKPLFWTLVMSPVLFFIDLLSGKCLVNVIFFFVPYRLVWQVPIIYMKSDLTQRKEVFKEKGPGKIWHPMCASHKTKPYIQLGL